MDTQALIDKLTKAISFQFKEDKTAPGLTISALKIGYYCSIVRYSQAFGKGKIVVCKAKSDTLPAALKIVASEFLTCQKKTRDPVDELGDLVRGSK